MCKCAGDAMTAGDVMLWRVMSPDDVTLMDVTLPGAVFSNRSIEDDMAVYSKTFDATEEKDFDFVIKVLRDGTHIDEEEDGSGCICAYHGISAAR